MRVRPEEAFKDLTGKAVNMAVKISHKKDLVQPIPPNAMAKARHQSILALEAITKVVSELFEADHGQPSSD